MIVVDAKAARVGRPMSIVIRKVEPTVNLPYYESANRDSNCEPVCMMRSGALHASMKNVRACCLSLQYIAEIVEDFGFSNLQARTIDSVRRSAFIESTEDDSLELPNNFTLKSFTFCGVDSLIQ